MSPFFGVFFFFLVLVLLAKGYGDVVKSEPEKMGGVLLEVENLLTRLKRLQKEEDRLEIDINNALSSLRTTREKTLTKKSCHCEDNLTKCGCNHRSAKEVLDMLSLSPDETNLLVKIVDMIKKGKIEEQKPMNANERISKMNSAFGE